MTSQFVTLAAFFTTILLVPIYFAWLNQVELWFGRAEPNDIARGLSIFLSSL
jgi:hypothetical protein